MKMKLSLIACASVVALTAFAAEGAFARNVSDGAAKGQASEGTMTGLSCPAGQVVTTNPATGKQSCSVPDMAVKGSGVPKNTSVNISDGAAKGQASEGTAPSTSATPTNSPR